MRVVRVPLSRGGALWLVLAALSLAGAGCQPRVTAESPGQRQEGGQENELQTVLQQAELPQSFAFGGRTWRAHQVHWVDASDAGQSGTGGTTGTGAGSAAGDGTGGAGMSAPGAAGGEGAGSGASAGSAGEAQEIGGYIPVANFQIQGHRIYRREGADEALTDNIFLKAEVSGTAPGGAGGGDAPDTSVTNGPAAGDVGESAGDSATGGGTGGRRVAFVEYDAAGDATTGMEMGKVLQTAGLPENLSHGGKTWNAQEVQPYDADVFADLKPMAAQVQGHRAYMSEDGDTLLLEAEVPMPMRAADTSGDTAGNAPAGNAPAANTPGPGETGGTGATGEDAAALEMKGPVFIRYEAGSGS